MVTPLKLCVGDYCLQISRINDIWYECILSFGDSSIRLGAEAPTYLKQHLSIGLTGGPKTSAGKLEGREVYWVLSLAENHHMLFAALDNTGVTLYWQAKWPEPVTVVAAMHLSREDCLEWRRQLEQL